MNMFLSNEMEEVRNRAATHRIHIALSSFVCLKIHNQFFLFSFLLCLQSSLSSSYLFVGCCWLGWWMDAELLLLLNPVTALAPDDFCLCIPSSLCIPPLPPPHSSASHLEILE